MVQLRFVIDNSTKLLEAIAGLLWPFIVAVLLWKLFPAIRGIVTSRSFSVKVGGIELSVQDATEQIRVQIEDLQKQVIELRSTRIDGGRLGLVQADDHGAVEQPKPGGSPAQPPRRILWVDDKPSNNAFEIAQLRKEGVDVEQVLSTAEALSALTSGGPFSAVVSDMGRMEGGKFRAKAGAELVEAMKNAGITMPLMIYTSTRAALGWDAAIRASGGTGATASPTILLEWIRNVLGSA